MFDTVLGLPVHILVVHGVVVLLPLMALLTVLLAMRPRWSARVAWGIVLADAAVFALTLVAQQSGEALQHRLGPTPAIQQHADLGAQMPWMGVALLAAGIAVTLLRRRAGSRVVLPVVALVVGGVVVWWTVRVGHSGSQAVWQEVVRHTTPR